MKIKEVNVSTPRKFKKDPLEQYKETKRLADTVTEELENIIENHSTLEIKGQSIELTGIELSGKEYVKKMTLIYGHGGIKITYTRKDTKS